MSAEFEGSRVMLDRRIVRRSLLLGVMVVVVCALVTLLALPTPAYATQDAGSGAAGSETVETVPCSPNMYSSKNDLFLCLPAGRWGGAIGSITQRTDPSNGILGNVANVFGSMGRSMRLMMPNMIMSMTQVLWGTALSLTQFAATFNPIDTMGAQVDHTTGELVTSVMNSSIPAMIIMAGLLAMIGAAAYQSGKHRSVAKRLCVSIACLGLVAGMGAAAANSTEKDAAMGSPWWVVRQINDVVNKMSVQLDLSHTNGADQQMSYRHKDSSDRSCQDYLAEMLDEYKNGAGKNAANSIPYSDYTIAVNHMWEETALRPWVTMQYGNPTESAASNKFVAQNAHMAYCHVLDMEAGINPLLQAKTTNGALGTSIDSDTANWIFTENGWLGVQNKQVLALGDGGTVLEQDSITKQSRAALFWETCTTNGKDVKARPGWSMLINNLSDNDSGQIENGKDLVVRPALDGKEVKNAKDRAGKAADDIMSAEKGADDAKANEKITTVCKAVLNNDAYAGKNRNESINTAGILSYRFDAPNNSATWNEANLSIDPNNAQNGARETVDYLYGNKSVDTAAGYGSLIASIANLGVWGFFAIILILSKFSLVFMSLFLVLAMFVQAVPIGEENAKALKRWSKSCFNVALVGTVYGLFGQLTLFTCNLIGDMMKGTTFSILYNLMIGMSPLLAMGLIAFIFSVVLHKGNIFSVKGMMNLATGGAMAGAMAGIASSGLVRTARGVARNAMHTRSLRRAFGNGNRMSSREMANSNPMGHTKSEEILNNAASAQEQHKTPLQKALSHVNNQKTALELANNPTAGSEKERQAMLDESKQEGFAAGKLGLGIMGGKLKNSMRNGGWKKAATLAGSAALLATPFSLVGAGLLGAKALKSGVNGAKWMSRSENRAKLAKNIHDTATIASGVNHAIGQTKPALAVKTKWHAAGDAWKRSNTATALNNWGAQGKAVLKERALQHDIKKQIGVAKRRAGEGVMGHYDTMVEKTSNAVHAAGQWSKDKATNMVRKIDSRVGDTILDAAIDTSTPAEAIHARQQAQTERLQKQLDYYEKINELNSTPQPHDASFQIKQEFEKNRTV